VPTRRPRAKEGPLRTGEEKEKAARYCCGAGVVRRRSRQRPAALALALALRGVGGSGGVGGVGGGSGGPLVENVAAGEAAAVCSG